VTLKDASFLLNRSQGFGRLDDTAERNNGLDVVGG
jgi:hypothetical protein